MAGRITQERLQPALLDRLVDDNPERKQEARDESLIDRQRLYAAVLRDLEWLFNSTRYSGAEELEGFEYVQRSVLNFGLPALSGETASTLDTMEVEQRIRQAILDFEPRIVPASLQVQALSTAALLDQHNIVSIQIRGHLWGNPAPLELLLQTDLDLETGAVEIRDLAMNR
ncbi:type VI secretion system baseplate subunit TssE [Pseudoduganella sp. OTU4001]|uniref:type VI secretion system baseplate subunit TssE n=1 Tax=Pseudoduganella sp. OTU4001 TaxID=3043854 RepID=UPI00313EF83D